MITYYDKRNDLKYILDEDKISIEREEIVNKQLNGNNLIVDEKIKTISIAEIPYSEVVNIHLSYEKKRSGTLFKCSIKIRNNKTYII